MTLPCVTAAVALAIAGSLGSAGSHRLGHTGTKKPMNLAHVPSSLGGDVGVPASARYLAAEADRAGSDHMA